MMVKKDVCQATVSLSFIRYSIIVALSQISNFLRLNNVKNVQVYFGDELEHILIFKEIFF